jgi:membrane protein required for colicin V production
MEINYFDLVAGIIILFLGLKGIINGFFKELFGLIGIIGGIFVASRVGDEVGEYLSNMIFKFENHAAISFTGFLVTLAVFWLFMVFIGFIFKKLSSMSGLGAVDKILGFIFGASKFFLIAAVIAHAAYNIKAVKSTIDSNMQNNSILFPILVKTGSFIMKLDPVSMSKDINATINSSTKTIEDKIEKTVNDSTLDVVEDVKKQIKESIPKDVLPVGTEAI